MSKGQLTLVFHNFENEHLGKDVFGVPYYLGKRLDMDVTIVFPSTKTNKKLGESYRGVTLCPLWCPKRRFFWIIAVWYLLLNSHKIDVLMQFHFSNNTLILGNIFKMLNKRGKLYIKCDGIYWLDEILAKQIPGTFKYDCYQRLLKSLDCLSIELLSGYQKLLNNTYCNILLKHKAVLMPNGFDEELINQFVIKEKKFGEKENIIITVARIGDENKNTKMFLEALMHVDLKDWKVYLIGPILSDFEKDIDSFFLKNPHKQCNVIFLGAVYDKKKLWEYYNMSKVFVLTSYNEGFPLVLSEAKRFMNYIVTTNIDAATDFVTGSEVGCIIEKNDIMGLATVLTNIVEGKVHIDISHHANASDIAWTHLVELIRL